MFSKILLKLVDESIVPAVFLLVTRLVSVVLVAKYFSIPFEIGASGFIFHTAQEYIIINTYSTFYMMVALAVGLLYILSKSLLFHETHIRPALSAKLFAVRLHSLIQSSFDLYTQGSIWLSYCYLMLFVSGFMTLFKLVLPWVFYVSAALSVITTLLFIFDIEEELKLSKRRSPEYDSSMESSEEE
jgi:hypothetical protein